MVRVDESQLEVKVGSKGEICLRVNVGKRSYDIPAQEIKPYLPNLFNGEGSDSYIDRTKVNPAAIVREHYRCSLSLTEKQLNTLAFILQYREKNCISPTLQEIADSFGITKISVYERINQLEKKGIIKREKYKARSILPIARGLHEL